MKLSETTKRNLAINFYKDQGLVLKDNNEVHFQGGIAGHHKDVVFKNGKLEVVFSPSEKMKFKKFNYALGEDK